MGNRKKTWVVTGYSHKRDGLCFVTQAEDAEEAKKAMAKAMGEKYRVEGDWLLWEEDEVPGEDDGYARPWALAAGEVGEDGFAQDAAQW